MKELLKFARESLENYLKNEKVSVSENIIKKYSKKQACFVTLTENGELRGCIGSLQAHQELWKDIVDNAINAGFRDSRFLPLSSHEIDKIKIEISILSDSKKLRYKDEKDLLNKIDRKMGIILKKGFYSATFLPQVWEELTDKKQFLEHLSLKAGLDKDAWKDSEILFYRVESVKEE
jgi:AmmeMemoRadiSam system protein A